LATCRHHQFREQDAEKEGDSWRSQPPSLSAIIFFLKAKEKTSKRPKAPAAAPQSCRQQTTQTWPPAGIISTGSRVQRTRAAVSAVSRERGKAAGNKRHKLGHLEASAQTAEGSERRQQSAQSASGCAFCACVCHRRYQLSRGEHPVLCDAAHTLTWLTICNGNLAFRSHPVTPSYPSFIDQYPF
jgi:hypothetical protein